MKLIFSGVVIPVSTIDWYGRSVCMIFFNGCNFKCLYCSNNDFIKAADRRIEPLYKGGSVMEIQEIEKMIMDARMFISAVVFSGGEPTTQYEALEHLARFAKEQGLLVGIETNGYYPDKLLTLIEKKLIDKIFLDIKAPLDDAQQYSYITGGGKDAAICVRKSLDLNNIEIEARTTVFPSICDCVGIARSLVGKNCTYVIQQGIPENAPKGHIRNETALTRDELAGIAQSISFLKDVRIRTKQKGEEQIITN